MKNFVKSPFMYIAKSKIKLFNRKKQKNISYKNFHKLIAKGLIREHHYDILKLLLKYRHLTVLTIDTFLKSNNNKFWTTLTNTERKRTINSILKTLENNGLVQYNLITWKSNDINSRFRTPNHYKLTKGGIACIKKLWNIPVNIEKYSKQLSISMVLKELAINQMISNYKLKAQYLEKIVLNEQIKNTETKKWFNLHVIFIMKKEANTIQFIVEPVRRNNFWKKNIVTKLSVLQGILEINYIKKIDNELIENPIIVLLCEDVPHIKECFNTLYKTNLISENLFFTTDSLQLSTELVNTLMKIKPDNKKLNLIEYEIDYLS